jgi:hypothetical protein
MGVQQAYPDIDSHVLTLLKLHSKVMGDGHRLAIYTTKNINTLEYEAHYFCECGFYADEFSEDTKELLRREGMLK